MHPCTGGLTGRVQSLHVRAAHQVSPYAAHQVMRRGTHRYQIALQIERIPRQKRAYARETRVQIETSDVAHVQEHLPRFTDLVETFVRDRSRNHVAWSQFEQVVIALHESLAVFVAKIRTLASQRFRHEKPWRSGKRERRRMKLVELHVSEFRTSF